MKHHPAVLMETFSYDAVFGHLYKCPICEARAKNSPGVCREVKYPICNGEMQFTHESKKSDPYNFLGNANPLIQQFFTLPFPFSMGTVR